MKIQSPISKNYAKLDKAMVRFITKGLNNLFFYLKHWIQLLGAQQQLLKLHSNQQRLFHIFHWWFLQY